MDSIGGKMMCSIKGAVTRGIMLCLILCAANSTWADGESLAETGGYVPTSGPALAFKNMTLEKIGTQYALSGKIGGGYINSEVKGSSTLPFNRYSYQNEMALRYEMQVLDGSIVKCVRLKFTQVGDDVYAQAIGAAAGDNGSNYWLGMQFQTRVDEGTVKNYYQAKAVDTENGGGYGIYNLSLSAYPELLYRFDFDSNAENNGGTCGSTGLKTQGTLSYATDKKKFGTGSLSLNSSNSSLYVQNTTSGIVSKEDGWTVSFWVCPNAMSNWRDVCGLTCGNVRYKIEKTDNRAFQMYNDQNNNNTYPALSTPLSYDDNSSSWVNIVLVSAANGNGFDVYKNGSFAQGYNQNDGASSVYGTKTEALMRVCAGVYDVGGGDRTSSALIDEVSVYKGALNATEIAYLAENTAPIFQRLDGSEITYSLPSAATSDSNVVVSLGETATVTFDSEVTANKLTFMSSAGGVMFAGTKPTATLDYSRIVGEVTYPWTWTGEVSSRSGGLRLTGGAGTSESAVRVTPTGGSITFDGSGETPYYLSFGNSETPTTINFNDAEVVTSSFDLGAATAIVGGTSQISATRVVLSQGGGSRAASLTVKDSAKLTVTGTNNLNSNQASIMFGHWNGPSTFTLQDSAEFYAPDTDVLIGVTRNNQTINIEGGVFTARGIKLATYATGTNILNLSGDGELKLGSAGIGTYASGNSMSVNVTGDAKITTMESEAPITQAVSVSANKTLTLDGGGTITFTSLTLASGSRLCITNGTTVVINGGTIDDSAIISIDTGASLSVSSADLMVGQINCASNGSLSIGAGRTLTVKNCGSISGTVSGTGNIILMDGGTLDIASAVPCKITANAGATVNANGTFALSGSNKIDSGATLNITGGNVTLTTNGGGDGIKGTVNIENGSTLTVNTGDALWYGASAGNGIVNVKSNGTLAMGSTRWTLGANNQINLYENATITGDGPDNGNLDMNHNNGTKTIHALGSATISATIAARRDENCEIIVDEGKTLTVSSRIFGGYQITKKGAGTLKLTYPTGNTGTGDNSFTVPGVSAGTLEFAGSGTWNVNAGEVRDLSCYAYTDTVSIAFSVNQTKAEYGRGSNIEVFGIPSGISSITVNMKGGGDPKVASVSDGVAAIAGSGNIVIDGEATLYDITFANNTSDTKDSGTFTYKGVAAGTLKYDTNPTFNDAGTGVYLKHHPYIDGAQSIFNSLTDFTAVVVGQMSPSTKTEFIHFGSTKSAGNTGLLIATTENANEVVIASTTYNTVNDAAGVTVKIPNAATARHAFVIIKSGTTFSVYADGVKRGTFNVAEGFKLGVSGHSGIQVGSDFGGTIADAAVYTNVADNESETGVVDVIRVFDYAISEAQALAVTDAYPYVPQGGLYTRTVSADANLSADGTWAKDGSESTFALPEGATVREQFFDPSATITVADESTLVVNADLQLETLTIGGSEALTIESDGVYAIRPTTAIINTTVTNVYGAVDFKGTTVQFSSEGALCIDCSDIDISKYYVSSTIQLTGTIDNVPSQFSVILPTATISQTASLHYNDNGFYELIITPDHEDGSDVYYTGGYWSSDSNNTISVTNSSGNATIVFPGDTVVIPVYYAGTEAWFAANLPANVSRIRVARDFSFHAGVTDAILGGATITVDADKKLTVNRKASGQSAVTLGSVTFSGDGTVQLGSTDDVSKELALSGGVVCNATISIPTGVTVTFGRDAALTVGIYDTIDEKQLTTNEAHSRVRPTTDGETKTYRVEEIPGTIFSVW